jgi:hypothetical protein
MTFAIAKTKREVIKGINPIMAHLGYQLYEQEKGSIMTTYRRELTADVVVNIRVWFFDGPMAAQWITWMSGGIGFASRKLLALYYSLCHGKPSNTLDYFPFGCSLEQYAPEPYGRKGWKFELPGIGPTLADFEQVLSGPIEAMCREYDTAEKQIEKVLIAPRNEVCWNDIFFDPVSLLYLGRADEAIARASAVLETSRSEEFAKGYRRFLARIRKVAAKMPAKT